eukprot:TRINITY_DN96723_c0_g1_i1.p1 TRINITY_DN96723_c0_g1~~TRINITY_DN96723_c0_g1_i1.p1  ORF type:complete len:252 (+),score=27.66 TRINITY_DN96723_c0_g1_i1:57-812(+)
MDAATPRRQDWSTRPKDDSQLVMAVPAYYRHWGRKHRQKAAVGMGHYEASEHRYLHNRPRLPQQHWVDMPMFGDRPQPQTPEVYEDWDDFEDFADTRQFPKAEAEMERPRQSTRSASSRGTPRFSDKLRKPPGSATPRLDRSPAVTRAQGTQDSGLGILPLPKSQLPTFGYGVPAVLKSVPPCAAAQFHPEVKDIPPEDRFSTSHREFFKAIPLSARPSLSTQGLPVRYVPASNRHVKELALGVHGQHVRR